MKKHVVISSNDKGEWTKVGKPRLTKGAADREAAKAAKAEPDQDHVVVPAAKRKTS